MTKNTRAKLTLIFSVNKKNVNLEQAIKAIETQNDNNFCVVFAFNNANLLDKQIVSEFDSDKVEDVQHVFFSESLGDSYVFNYCLKKVKTKYVYFLDANIFLEPDFVATINHFIEEHKDTDVLSFFGVPNYYFKEEFIEIKKPADDFCTRPLIFFNNKVLNVEYLLKHHIQEPLFAHYPLSFYLSLFIYQPKWYSIGRQICTITNKVTYLYNVLDLYADCENLTSALFDKKYKDYTDQIEYIILIGLLRNFIFAYFESNQGRVIAQKRVLEKVEEFLQTYIPDWRRNKWLWSKKNLNDTSYLDYLRDFKPKIRYITKEMNSDLFKKRALGYENSKRNNK